VKAVVVGIALLAAGGCEGTPPPAAMAPPPASIELACGPWMPVEMDRVIGPAGLTGRTALAAMVGSHALQGPSVTGDPDTPGELTFEVAPPAGAGRVVLSLPDSPAAPAGSCGVRMEIAAHAYTPDGAIDARFDRATLLFAGGQDMSAGFSAAMPDLPEPYQATDPLTLEVGMVIGPARPVAVDAALKVTSNHLPIWTWTGVP
jgi:hypothetical protein